MQTPVKVLLIFIVATFLVVNAGYAKKALAAVCDMAHPEQMVGCELPPGTYFSKQPPHLTKEFCLEYNERPYSSKVDAFCHVVLHGYQVK